MSAIELFFISKIESLPTEKMKVDICSISFFIIKSKYMFNEIK